MSGHIVIPDRGTPWSVVKHAGETIGAWRFADGVYQVRDRMRRELLPHARSIDEAVQAIVTAAGA